MVCGGRLASVADRAGVARRLLVGRAGEVEAVIGLVDGAVQGEAGALLISGEAGVGKTALVREASEQVGGVADVLWAPCLPLTSLAVPFLSLTSALRAWASGRQVPVPVLGGSGEEGPAGFDVWLDGQCRQRPMVLVVDDLQWADQSSLDVLMYVLAGLAGRPLAIVTTVRAGEEGDPLRRWLADVRRLPGVRELHLDRLDRVATGEQIAGLLGRPPHQSLVDDVYARTQGNAYLTALLARGLSTDARSLPAGLPTGLRDAATHAWHGLSAPARELTRLVAIAGRPQRADQLQDVAATATGVRGELVRLLREAVDGAVLDVGDDGTYWFVHPLLAEVLEAGLLPEEREALHAAFAATLEPTGNTAELSVEAAVDLADHHHRAGHQQQAYRWALRAANAAERAGGASEMLRLLRRALDLWPQAPDPGGTEEELLLRIREAAARAGSFEEELAAIEDLLALVNRDRQPLRAAELLVRRMHLRFLTGREFFPVADMQEAVRLAVADPHSAEHALAMAELADAELWHNMPTGRARADEAVRLARACRSDRALTYALVAWVMARVMTDETGRFAAGVSAAEEARAAAARTRDFFGFVHATLWAGNCLDTSVSREYVDYSHSSRNEMTRLGAPHAYIAWLSAVEAAGLLLLGDWRLRRPTAIGSR